MNETLPSLVQQQKRRYLESKEPEGGGGEPMKAQDRYFRAGEGGTSGVGRPAAVVLANPVRSLS